MGKLRLPRRRAFALSLAPMIAPMIASGLARAGQDWPTGPVRYINLFPAGGATDIMSRIVCQALSEITGQQVVVENKGGSGGVVGADAIAKAAPDGSTIGLFSIASHSIAPTLYVRLPYDAARDFTPVAMMWSVCNLLYARLALPARSVPELIQLAKAAPGKYSFASSGAGTTPHICGELLKQKAGLDLLHVPYRGGAPAAQDLMANNVDVMFDNIPGPLSLHQSGKVRGLAVTSAKRHPAVPDLPAMAEILPGFDLTSWGGICGPAGQPPAMVERCAALTRQALESAPVKEAFFKQAATAFWLSPADTAAYRAAEEKRLAPIVKNSGAKVE